MFWNNTNNIANSIWAVAETLFIIGSTILLYKKAQTRKEKIKIDHQEEIDRLEGKVEKHDMEEALNKQIQLFEDNFDQKIREISKVLERINYAIFNDGKTGLVNKVDSIIEKQAEISTSVEVLKSQIKLPIRRRNDAS